MRLAAAYVPEDVRFATKPKLGVAMIERAFAADVPSPGWRPTPSTVPATLKGRCAAPRRQGLRAGANANHPCRSWGMGQRVSGTAEAIARDILDAARTRVSAGEGTKGARLHNWQYLPLADLDAGEFDGPPGAWTRGLLVQRHGADGSMAFFSLVPAGYAARDPYRRGRPPLAIEDAFETAKNELSLDPNETRSWLAPPRPRSS